MTYPSTISKEKHIAEKVMPFIGILVSVFLFLISIDLMSQSFRALSNDIVHEIIRATANPFISLFIGLLSTAIIQSSSTTTSMVVAIVASGRLGFDAAIPIIMGANIGTTVTSNIVSLGYITKKKEFRKAIAAATLHDFFNILVVLLLFPLEFFTGFLSNLSQFITQHLVASEIGDTKVSWFSIHEVTAPLANFVAANPLIMLLFCMTALFTAVRIFIILTKSLLIGDVQKKLEERFFKNPFRALSAGALVTAAVQSSSVTTSLIVPLVATNKISLKKMFPFLMGANIGTTLTAIVAAISQSDAAISIAIAHLLFNLIGVCILFPIPAFRNIPVIWAKQLGRLTIQNRLVGFGYVIFTFFLLPFMLIFFSSDHDFLTEKQSPKQHIERVE